MSELEEQLQELGGDIAAALEDLGLPAALLDDDAVIRWQNPASAALTGNVVGREFIEVVAARELPEVREVLKRILGRGEPAEITLDLLTAAVSPFRARSAPSRSGTPAPSWGSSE